MDKLFLKWNHRSGIEFSIAEIVIRHCEKCIAFLSVASAYFQFPFWCWDFYFLSRMGKLLFLRSPPHLVWLSSLSLLLFAPSILLREYFQGSIFSFSGHCHRALWRLVEFHIFFVHMSYIIMDSSNWKRSPSHLSNYLSCLWGEIDNSCQVQGRFHLCLNMQENPNLVNSLSRLFHNPVSF